LFSISSISVIVNLTDRAIVVNLYLFKLKNKQLAG